MKVLIIHEDRRSYGEGGGAETMLRDQTQALRMRGHEVEWYQGDEDFEECIARYKPDVCQVMTIHNFLGFGPVLWLQKHNYPHAWALMDYWPFCGGRMLLLAVTSSESCAAVEGICDHQCQHDPAPPRYLSIVNSSPIVALNEYTAEIYQRHGLRTDFVVHLGTDHTYFKPDRKRRIPGSIYTMSAWPQWPTKGMHVLRAALLKLDVQGKLITGQPREIVRDELQKADIFVFPSCYEETWGLCLSEAMASGCACIASDVCGSRAQIDDGVNGLLFPNHDVNALAEKIQRLLDDVPLRARLGAAARETIESERTLDHLGQRWERVYKAIVDSRGE